MASQPLDTMISINLTPLMGSKALNNNWVDNEQTQNHQLREKEVDRKILGQNDNIQNMARNNNPVSSNVPCNPLLKMRREAANGVENDKIVPRSSRVRSTMCNNFNKTAKERDLTPSRIINNIRNIRLSDKAVVAIGDNSNMMQIQRVPVNSLLEESKKLIATQEEYKMQDLSIMELVENVLQTLCAYNQQKSLNSALFPFKKDKVMRLCQEASKVVLN